MKKILSLLGSLLVVAGLFTSCLKDEDYVLSGNAVITSFSINDIQTKVPSITASGNDTTLIKKVYGSSYKFAINQLTGEVYNIDSLPKGTDVTHVTANMTIEGGSVYYYQNEETKVYSSEDSIDFSMPVRFTVYSVDGKGSRNYYIRLNVHQADVDSLVWTRVEENNFPAGHMTAEKMVQQRDYLLVFGEIDGVPTVMEGQLNNKFVFTPKASTLSGVSGKVDYSSIVVHENAVYLLADGKLYSSISAVEWTAESPERTFTSMVGVIDGKLCLNEGGTIVACDPYEWSTDNRVEYFTHDWEVVQMVDESLFPVNPSVVSSALRTNTDIVRFTLFGYPKEYTGNNVSIWTKLTTDSAWTYYHPIEGNGQACPVLERLTVVDYDDKLYAFGGAAKDGSLQAFEAIFTSTDGGITWWKQRKKIGFPEELKGYDEPFACVVDTERNIWIVCSNGMMFKGRI